MGARTQHASHRYDISGPVLTSVTVMQRLRAGFVERAGLPEPRAASAAPITV